MEAYKAYTPFDPEAKEEQLAVNMAFINQAVPDIWKKLQWLDGFAGKQLAKLVTTAEKVTIGKLLKTHRLRD